MALISEHVPEAWEYMTSDKSKRLPGHTKDLITDMAQELANFRAVAKADKRVSDAIKKAKADE